MNTVLAMLRDLQPRTNAIAEYYNTCCQRVTVKLANISLRLFRIFRAVPPSTPNTDFSTQQRRHALRAGGVELSCQANEKVKATTILDSSKKPIETELQPMIENQIWVNLPL